MPSPAKERPDSTAILTHVRVVWSKPCLEARKAEHPPGLELEQGSHLSSQGYEPKTAALDFTDPGEEGLHPTHRRLLHLFHQPSPEMLHLAFWREFATGTVTLDPQQPFARGPWDLACLTSLAKQEFFEFGHGRLPVDIFAHLENCLEDLVNVMTKLQERGLPPVQA